MTDSTKRTPCVRCGKPCVKAECAKCWIKSTCSVCGEMKAQSTSLYRTAREDRPAFTCHACRRKRAITPVVSESRAARKRELVRVRQREIVGSRDCEHCGTAFPLTVRGRKKGQRFCSHECDDLAELARRAVISCTDCGIQVSVPPSRGNRRFRCAGCLESWRNRPREPKPQSRKVYFPACDLCGRVFCAKTCRSRLCSAKCKIDDINARTKSLYALATQFNTKTGQYVGGSWRAVLLEYLVERDGDKCGVCGKKVNIALKSGTRGSRRGPSVDHVIPRSRGGSDDPANLRLTHWGCNQKRGNRGGNEQLALVG